MKDYDWLCFTNRLIIGRKDVSSDKWEDENFPPYGRIKFNIYDVVTLYGMN
ncbi:hypothetical protein J19TS1_35090 [Heyndrickxia oleronia]|nr:hypothetical protein J19TS1_35090 [Heyndrickxia oleronia]